MQQHIMLTQHHICRLPKSCGRRAKPHRLCPRALLACNTQPLDVKSLDSTANVVTRRGMLLSSLLLPCSLLQTDSCSAQQAGTESNSQFEFVRDNTLAYQFSYPLVTVSGTPLSLRVVRAPQPYSSAPPLTTDGRQRMVAQLLDFKNKISVSVSVGPASGGLADSNPQEWKPRDVAFTVLGDRSTGRVSNGQRVALNDIEEVHSEEKGGQVYWVYEHLSQRSPTPANNQKETYRHALAITSWRAGISGRPFLYTLNLSCPEEQWDQLAKQFEKSVQAFELKPTTAEYVAPDSGFQLF